MIDYTRLTWLLKREILSFSEKICKGLWKPEFRLASSLLYGIAESGSCHLSKIGRALKESITLKKTIDRLSRGLRDFSEKDRQCLQDNYAHMIGDMIDDRTVFIVDGSDATKPHSKAMEGLALVRDGSTGKIEKGYHTLEIAALSALSKSPLPVYDRVYSSLEEDFVSEDEEVLAGLRYVSKTFGKQGIRTLDRGYDALTYYEYFLKNHENFIIRAAKNRNIRYKGETKNILEVALMYKGKYRIDFHGKKGKPISCKTSIIPVSLSKYPNISMNLVVVYGFGKEPMLLMTNLRSDDPRLANTVAKVYLMRWRIEEYFRFKKQQYRFEDFRVRSLSSIRSLHRILTLLAGLISLLSEKRDRSVFVMDMIAVSKRIYCPKKEKAMRVFLHYAIGDAFFVLLRKSVISIAAYLAPKKKSGQMTMFALGC